MIFVLYCFYSLIVFNIVLAISFVMRVFFGSFLDKMSAPSQLTPPIGWQ